jgi:hypothetical protein
MTLVSGVASAGAIGFPGHEDQSVRSSVLRLRVQASDADTAIRRAVEKFEVPAEWRSRIMARPIAGRP